MTNKIGGALEAYGKLAQNLDRHIEALSSEVEELKSTG